MQSYAIPIGLCLDALSQDQQSVQFRQGPFVPSRLRKKRIKQAAAYLMLCSALSLLTWVSTHTFLEQKEKALREQLQTYLETYGGLKAEFGEEGLEQDIAAWEKSLSKQKRPFPYLPSIPQVSDVLAWISSHPKLNVKESCEAKAEKIEIKQVHYSLVKYPKIGETLDPYQAKVDLEFSSDSPRLAREFHDALMAGDSMVNPKSEITWNVHQNTYRTSFFLKPQKTANIK